MLQTIKNKLGNKLRPIKSKLAVFWRQKTIEKSSNLDAVQTYLPQVADHQEPQLPLIHNAADDIATTGVPISNNNILLEAHDPSVRNPKVASLQERFPAYQFGKGTYDTNLQIHAWGEGATLKIGAFSSIAADVQIFLGGEHRTDWVTTYPFNVLWEAGKQFEGHPATKGDVVIGNDVWIGTEAVILSGVTIGDGAVIGARAVVAKDIPPYSVAVGNPARVIRTRFDEVTIQQLLQIKWWNWDDTQISACLPLLLNANVSAFLEAAISHGHEMAELASQEIS